MILQSHLHDIIQFLEKLFADSNQPIALHMQTNIHCDPLEQADHPKNISIPPWNYVDEERWNDLRLTCQQRDSQCHTQTFKMFSLVFPSVNLRPMIWVKCSISGKVGTSATLSQHE